MGKSKCQDVSHWSRLVKCFTTSWMSQSHFTAAAMKPLQILKQKKNSKHRSNLLSICQLFNNIRDGFGVTVRRMSSQWF